MSADLRTCNLAAIVIYFGYWQPRNPSRNPSAATFVIAENNKIFQVIVAPRDMVNAMRFFIIRRFMNYYYYIVFKYRIKISLGVFRRAKTPFEGTLTAISWLEEEMLSRLRHTSAMHEWINNIFLEFIWPSNLVFSSLEIIRQDMSNCKRDIEVIPCAEELSSTGIIRHLFLPNDCISSAQSLVDGLTDYWGICLNGEVYV